jgi:putative molybdopterin biosynthesis protein
MMSPWQNRGVPRKKKPALPPSADMRAAAMMDTREVASYLRLKERRVYDLVRQNALPHIRATGKLLFPRAQIDAWLAAKSGAVVSSAQPASPPIIAGSHDPLLEWAARESRCGLAILSCGSSAGLEHLALRQATLAAMHWLDPATGEYNVPLVRARMATDDVVVIEWAKRAQGLVLAKGNPLGIRTLADLAKRRARVVPRQTGAGSHHLFAHLLQQARIDSRKLAWCARPALAETDLAATIHAGRADAGMAIEAAARAHALAFIPLAVERLDLVVRRRDYFEPPVQTLLGFLRTGEFAAQANALGGYDAGAAGRIVFNS